MKYLEELKSGDFFEFGQDRFILTADFTQYKNQPTKRKCINISNGFIHWLLDDSIVNKLDLYLRDDNGHIIALKETKNEYSDKNQEFS